MSDTILAALIGATSSIVVALVGRRPADGTRLESRSAPGHQLPPLAWVVTLAILAVWLLISPGAIHHDLSGTNFFLIPIVLFFLAIVKPIRPLTAGWVSLAIYSANFILGPLGNRLVGSRHDTGLDPANIWPMFLIGFVAAAIVAAVCALRLRQRHPTLQKAASPITQEEIQPTGSALTAALERLVALHSDGKLSDDEFRTAKERLLGVR